MSKYELLPDVKVAFFFRLLGQFSLLLIFFTFVRLGTLICETPRPLINDNYFSMVLSQPHISNGFGLITGDTIESSGAGKEMFESFSKCELVADPHFLRQKLDRVATCDDTLARHQYKLNALRLLPEDLVLHLVIVSYIDYFFHFKIIILVNRNSLNLIIRKKCKSPTSSLRLLLAFIFLLLFQGDRSLLWYVLTPLILFVVDQVFLIQRVAFKVLNIISFEIVQSRNELVVLLEPQSTVG